MPIAYSPGMASLLSALLAKYDALTAANFFGGIIPPAFEDRVPEVVNGNQLYPPYTTFSLTAGDEMILTFEDDDVEPLRLVVVTYAPSTDATDGQAQADQNMKAIRFNGQNPNQNAGFDNSNSLPTLTEGVLLSILPMRPPAPALAGRGKEGKAIYKTTMEYTVNVERS